MHPLPKFVTGFDFPAQGVQFKVFKAACHTAARQVGARVLEIRDASMQVAPNFHQALMSLHHGPQTVRVLCNVLYPIVAFTPPVVANEWNTRLQFLDCSPLAEALSGQFNILDASHASARIPAELIAVLGKADLEELHYRKPQQLGELIFNDWD